jgi:hypothetical protein
VGLGVVDHLAEALARRALVAPSLLDLGPDPLEAIEELVADGLQLTKIGDPRSRPGKRLRRSLRYARLGRLLGIGRQQRLQPRDLTPQSPPGRPSVLLAGRSERSFGVGRRGRLPP